MRLLTNLFLGINISLGNKIYQRRCAVYIDNNRGEV